MPTPPKHKSGQAIIFLMVVVVIGVIVVVWNFDLHRVITAKMRVRNATDAAALAGARWQGITLNMIGDLNLIQAAILSNEAEDQRFKREFTVPPEVDELHDLRSRLAFIGPLAAYSLAQQTAFNNGAFRDPALEADLRLMAEEVRTEVGEQPYDNAFQDYADLLDYIAGQGAAVSSYQIRLPNRKNVLVDEKFYAAIAQAMAGWWCPMYNYQHELKTYESVDDWTEIPEEIKHRYIFDLKLDGTFVSSTPGALFPTNLIPGIAVPNNTDYRKKLLSYLNVDEETGIIDNYGNTNYVMQGIYPPVNPSEAIHWHVYGGNWAQTWPDPAQYSDEAEDPNESEGADRRLNAFPLRSRIQGRFNYMGAEAGVGIVAPVGRGILSSSGNDSVNLIYKSKAKPFGYLDVDSGDEVPYYLGYVFPAFRDVRLIHSDIGDKILSTEFYHHVMNHLYAYLEGGPDALNPSCRYCQLLKAWEKLDRKAGLRWLEEAYKRDDNPCEPDREKEYPWGNQGGGATGGT